MTSFKKTFGLVLCLGTCFSVNAFANVDVSGVAQLETNLPQPQGALTADQIPPLSIKTIMADETAMYGTAEEQNPATTTAQPAASAPAPTAPPAIGR